MRLCRRIAPFLAGVGFIVAVIGWALRTPVVPGRLIAQETAIAWRSPAVELGQLLPQAKARFRLTNPGGRTVNILEVVSGCGCTSPVPSATVIGPGKSITLDVEGKPFPIGDRTVAITVRTDSAETPTVALRFRMIGSREPPFLLEAVGELAFVDIERSRLNATGIDRRFTVRMIELESTEREPSFRVTPGSLIVEKVSSTIDPYTILGHVGTVLRTHVYKVSFAEPPDEGRIAGMVSVVDPWLEGHVTDLKVYAEVRSRLKAIPARVDLIESNGELSAEFMVLTKEPHPIPLEQYQVEVESPLHVEPIMAKGGTARFRITAPIAADSGGTTRRITIRVAAIADESAAITVATPGARP